MITKLTAGVMSVIMTVGLVAAAAPTVEPTKSVDITRMAFACAQGYTSWRFSTGPNRLTGEEALNNVLIQFPENQRPAVTLICFGYGIGYEDGVKGMS